jgi:hypothetical protein
MAVSKNDLMHYSSNPRCKICSSLLNDGRELRPVVEKMRADGFTYEQICQYSTKNGVPMTDQNITNHMKVHAPYCKIGSGISRKTLHTITELTHSSDEAAGALKKIIAIGNMMIDNWWNNIQGQPQMPVTGKLLMDALKEEGKRSAKTTLDAEFEDLQKQAIEGEEAIDGETSDRGQGETSSPVLPGDIQAVKE